MRKDKVSDFLGGITVLLTEFPNASLAKRV